MPSIVGISCNPAKSKMKWEKKVSHFTDWEIIAKYPLKDQARVYGLSYAYTFLSDFITESGKEESMWYVYRFDYIK
ncbi:hypothetical protein [Fulvivirga lutea]|uniref:Uncharacterized protein n=1 Tax=Fulvivirga lutea TaxID=2810512 RepID=A0A974WHL3_9BACT|nr:hypothetical protein [Fulvivirga lutea]QSE98699.1 hypothetical protein JR347_06360 [Fulvivirga lutea]